MKNRFCPAMWFSGFFGLAAIAHLIRLAVGFNIAINDWLVPKPVSALFVAVGGTFSIVLFMFAVRKPCDKRAEGE